MALVVPEPERQKLLKALGRWRALALDALADLETEEPLEFVGA